MTGSKGAAAAELLWQPDAERYEHANIAEFIRWLRSEQRHDAATYDDLWEWSVCRPTEFWEAIWHYFDLGADGNTYHEVLSDASMPGARWFRGARVNYARRALGHPSDRIAIVFRSESGASRSISYGDLRRDVARVAGWLRTIGIGPGDRVVAYMPSVPETVVAFLASAAVGAVWSACAPDLGVRTAAERFRQIAPSVLFAVDGYVYGGRVIERQGAVAELQAELPSLRETVLVRLLGNSIAVGAEDWDDVIGQPSSEAVEYADVDWDHPLWILYSSGTTGVPKPLVHGHGGILIEHLKTHTLHLDLKADDRFFWFTSTSWMMWNFLVSGLLVGSSIILFDGKPSFPETGALWGVADETRATFFGTSAPYIDMCMRDRLRPNTTSAFSCLKTIGSTAAPLSPEAYRWVYRDVSANILLASASGGTDVCTPFLGPCPLLPVYAGELQCRLLGVWVDAFSEDGTPLVNKVGELVVRAPMPSMPLYLWNDHSGAQYHESYFGMFPGVWRHGDWVTITERGTAIIHGRSDSTLKRGGIRTGTGEFYAVLEKVNSVADSVVIDTTAWGKSEIVLFVVLGSGLTLDDELVREIKRTIREGLSPRHIPDRIISVAGVPRTQNGKKLEVPIRRILEGASVESILARDAVEDPAALADFVTLAASIST